MSKSKSNPVHVLRESFGRDVFAEETFTGRVRYFDRKFYEATNGEKMRVPVAPENIADQIREMSGKISYTLTNDRMFRGAVSWSGRIREELVRILMGYECGRSIDVEIMNPINFGGGPDEKETEEDVRLLVNRETQVNIELQNISLSSNKPRFLLYLCRNYNLIGSGGRYQDLKSSIQVGILNYSPKDISPEFYAKYRFMNVKTHEPLFSDDDYFGINVLDLTKTNLADPEDQRSGRLLLAGLFRAETWEELREIAEDSIFAKEVLEYMYMANADVEERRKLEAHQRYLEVQATWKYEIEQTMKQLEQSKQEMEQNKQLMEQNNLQMEQNNQKMQQNNQKMEQNNQKMEQMKVQIKDSEVREKQANARAEKAEAKVIELDKENVINSRRINELLEENAKLKEQLDAR